LNSIERKKGALLHLSKRLGARRLSLPTMLILALIAAMCSVVVADQSAQERTAPSSQAGSLIQLSTDLSRSHRSSTRNARDEGMPYLMEENSVDESSLMPADALFEESETFHLSPRFRMDNAPATPVRRVNYASAMGSANASRLEKFEKTKSWEEEMMERISKYRLKLQQAKDDIVQGVTQIRKEKAWVHDVNKIMRTYVDKVNRVTNNIKKLQEKTKRELKLKKMTEKNIMQTTLAVKLKEAQMDYYTLEKALKSTNKQSFRFKRSQVDVKKDIDRIRQTLGTLESNEEAAATSDVSSMAAHGTLTQGEEMGEPDLEKMESVDSLISTV